MSDVLERPRAARLAPTTTYDAVIVGAGFSGMYMLHKLRDQQGLRVRVFEAGSGVGGTWYWNRYPGARCDSDSYVYCYTFDRALLQEWEWSERYPEQPEILRYLNHVADRLDLRRDIQFDTRVTGARFDEDTKRWIVRTDTGEAVSAQFLIGAVGTLSASNIPKFYGLETFEGAWYHTSQWPHDGVDFTAKRVGVIGTGATAVQAIPVIAEQAKHLTVFQRTPNFCVPARNGKVDPRTARERKANYEQIIQTTRNSFAGFEIDFIYQTAKEVSPEERERAFDQRWDQGGFGYWIGNYQDMFFDEESNELCADYLRRKIRSIVKDPKVADKLVPTTYPFGTKRQPLESNYFDTFNKPTVALVDLNEEPLESVTAKGVRTAAREYPLDILVVATGFDAMTGPFTRMGIVGRGNQTLAEAWSDGPRNYLGIAVAGFPNLFTITGPGSPSVISNMPVSIEQHVEWVADGIAHLRANGLSTIEASREAEEAWTDHVAEVANSTLFPKANSWYMGRNIPGKRQVFMAYLGGVGPYRAKCDEVARNGYEGFTLGA